MMKAVLISIKPTWVEKIAQGEKTVEVRKTKPKIDVPFKCYIYETKAQFIKSVKGACTSYGYGRGKVVSEFVCDSVDEYTFSNLEAEYRINDIDIAKTCLNHLELIGYGEGKPLYGWHISKLKIYDKPKSIKEFRKPCPYLDLPCSYCPSCDSDENDNLMQCFNTVSRPPQSWCYVEGLK